MADPSHPQRSPWPITVGAGQKVSLDTTVQAVSNLDELAKLLEAAGHSTRLRILLALRDGEASPKGTAKRLEDQTLGRVAHHFRALAHAGLIQRTRSRPVRGAAENFYVL